MIEAILSLGGLGLLFGLFLGLAARKFAVDKDPQIQEIADLLPGANCGACGFAGCQALAEAIARGDAAAGACVALGSFAREQIAAVLGVDVEVAKKQIARLMCRGGNLESVKQAEYVGLLDCRSAQAFGYGGKACHYGCLGLGNCARACPFGAISMDKSTGLPVIDADLCTGCGICVDVCPQNVLQLVPADNLVFVACSSTVPGPQVNAVCSVGCIGCGICERTCRFDAIHVKDNLAVIDYTKCTNCGECVDKCPKKTIVIKNGPINISDAAI